MIMTWIQRCTSNEDPRGKGGDWAGGGSAGIDWKWEEREAVRVADQRPSVQRESRPLSLQKPTCPKAYQGVWSSEAEGTLGDVLQEIQSAEM